MSKIQYEFNVEKGIDSIYKYTTPELVARGEKIINQWASLGYLPVDEESHNKLLAQGQKVNDGPLSETLLKQPHPVRTFDNTQLPFVTVYQFKAFSAPYLAAAADPEFTIDDMEAMLALLAQQTEIAPEAAEFLRQTGVRSLFTQFVPLMHVLQKAPTFDLVESACNEIDMLDIGKGIDSVYMHTPAPFCYFNLAKCSDTVHDATSGYHELEGFYAAEIPSGGITLVDATIERLNLDPSKPIRHLSLIFVGKPKERLTNDTVNKIEVFLQDGLTLDDVVNNTLSWYSGENNIELGTDTILFNIDGANYQKPDIDTIHNIKLLRRAMNVLAYLNFADFRQQPSKERSVAENAVMAKNPKNRSKIAKKMLGKSDTIVISSKVKDLGERKGGAGHSKSKHFRRGHLRNQRYGSGDNVHYKPIYIAPTIVGAGGDGETDIKNYVVK